ncbi:MAG: 23S rRNA (guanosine(2251)-2'-O)-methyltransferase RlmB [Thermomicrobiales bacterium]|nr:23S rRNA (guanosine(2251)-2'-O)-methyltransferase RlmB [Thermomicrobiales bacterium]
MTSTRWSSGNHRSVALVTSAYPYAEVLNLAELAANHRALLALDGLADPQNVGTLLRTAEITGIAGVIIPTDRAASITPAVVNASAGAVEHLNILQEVNLSRWLMRAKEAGFWVVGLAGDDEASSLFEVSMQPPVVIVTGSEGAGIRRLVRETCDIVAAIPMAGQIASLNAAVAGSIALYEVFRDRDSDSDAVVVT